MPPYEFSAQATTRYEAAGRAVRNVYNSEYHTCHTGSSVVCEGNPLLHINAQLRTQDAQAQTVEKGERDSNDSQKSALGPRKANAMTASSVSSS